MKSPAVLILLSVLITPVLAQTSFEKYVALCANGKLGKREASFVRNCGVEQKTAKVIYGESLDEQFTFAPIAKIGSSAENAKTDFFGTAEIWNVEGKTRIVNIWMSILDTGYYSNELFCVDDNGRVKLQETLNAYEPVITPHGGWIHIKRVGIDHIGNGKIIFTRFVTLSGRAVTRPKLDPDDLRRASSSSSTQFAADVIERLTRSR